MNKFWIQGILVCLLSLNRATASSEKPEDTQSPSSPPVTQSLIDPQIQRKTELDTLWKEVSRSVREGDFEGYAATCHSEGVLVSGLSQTSHPLNQALARWKQGFLDTRSGLMSASVEFRFRMRMGDETTAHETGIFKYQTEKAGETTVAYVHFEALLIKKDGIWQILMEYQKSRATEEDWHNLAAGNR